MLPGLRIGHAASAACRTGVTILVPDRPAVMAVDVRGGGPGTRETDALEPSTLVERAHGLALAGGSVFGLDAASELALLLARDRRGLAVAPGLFVPVVPAAILFDLANGGDKSWAGKEGGEPPYRQLARQAYARLSDDPAEGAVGAGYGAFAGAQKGGVAIARARLDGGGMVAVILVVNCFGEVAAGAPPEEGAVPMKKNPLAGGEHGATPRGNTCIGAVATDVPLARAAAKRIAMMAQDGLARAIRPVHTPFDGDTLFMMGLAPETPARVAPLLLAELGTRAADCVAIAARRAITLSNPFHWR